MSHKNPEFIEFICVSNQFSSANEIHAGNAPRHRERHQPLQPRSCRSHSVDSTDSVLPLFSAGQPGPAIFRLASKLKSSAVVELKFSSQKKHPTHSTRHASRGVCARSRCKHWAGRLQVYTSRFHFQTAAAACLLFCQPPPFPLLSFPMSSYWSKACSAQLNLTLLQLQRANYGCCMSSVSKVETVCAALQS